MKLNRFAKFSLVVLIYNLIVILWGAYVRATGAGAGCGSHWPLCNGQVIPLSPQLETVIEFVHRLSSGLALILVLIMFIWAFRLYPKSHPVRLSASLSMLFIVTEALVGAALVLFQWVAYDESIGRVVSISVHLVNTFLLLASLTLTVWWASGGERISLRKRGLVVWAFGFAFFAVMILGISGAITALGDTLFPPSTIEEGLRQDFSPTAHFLVRLRIWHPVVAVITGLYLFLLSIYIRTNRPEKNIQKFSAILIGLFILQLVAGLTNILLLAPVWMQLVHLLLADLVWITLVLLTAGTFSIEN
jgi:heme A synthase